MPTVSRVPGLDTGWDSARMGESTRVLMAQTNLPVLSAEGGLSRYLQEIRKFPMLEPNEEYMLAKRWKEHTTIM